MITRRATVVTSSDLHSGSLSSTPGTYRLVIVRDPAGVEPDDLFVTTDLTASGADIASATPADRGAFPRRQTRPRLRTAQSWKCQGPERAACLSLWLHDSCGAGNSTLTPPATQLDPPPLAVHAVSSDGSRGRNHLGGHSHGCLFPSVS
jgi:hypothetical protein